MLSEPSVCSQVARQSPEFTQLELVVDAVATPAWFGALHVIVQANRFREQSVLSELSGVTQAVFVIPAFLNAFSLTVIHHRIDALLF